MALSRSALGRATGSRRRAAGDATATKGVYATVAELVMLEAAARDFAFLPRQPVHSLLSGRHASRVRGRGLTFEELRPYLPGDDIRLMDWRATARMGKPFVRVHTEEKERSALLVVDQRINMFFGTRRAMKSVIAAEAAALCAWRVLADGDKVGGWVFNDEQREEVRPQRSRGAVARLCEAIAKQNQELRADSPALRMPARLDETLDAVASVASHDNLVVVASDFDGRGPRTRDLLLRLAMHNDVVLLFVYDPFLLELPSSGDLVVSDGDLQVELQLGGARMRKSIVDAADMSVRDLLGWQRELGIPVLPIATAEETATQIRRLLGQLVARRRGH